MSRTQWDAVARFLDRTAEAVMITDARTRILYVNRSFTRVTGYAPKDALGKTPRLLHSGRQHSAYYGRMWKALRAKGRWQGEIWNRRKSGAIYPEWLSITAVRDGRGRVGHYLAIFSDITVRKREEGKLFRLATHDALTGLPNRSFFTEQLRQAMARAKRAGRLAGLLFFDLDRFKPVNDRLGHECGDRLLQAVAKRVTALVREEDTVARLGGDEFGVILESLSRPRDAVPTARKILSALSRPFPLGGQEARISASIGIAVYPDDGKSAATLLARGDRAMYRAKRDGGDRYRFWQRPRAPTARAAPERAPGARPWPLRSPVRKPRTRPARASP